MHKLSKVELHRTFNIRYDSIDNLISKGVLTVQDGKFDPRELQQFEDTTGYIQTKIIAQKVGVSRQEVHRRLDLYGVDNKMVRNKKYWIREQVLKIYPNV